MQIIRKIEKNEKNIIINDIVAIHKNTFEGFFLTFMGEGFLKSMYRSYLEYKDSGIFVAFDNGKPVGFLAYSGNLSGLYKYMIRKRVILFALYSFVAFIRNPKVFTRLIRAFLKSGESKREEKYVELASIGVDSSMKSMGIGSQLVEALKATVDFNEYDYIALETDAVDNDLVNYFYKKNKFVLEREFETYEGRKMYEYRYKR